MTDFDRFLLLKALDYYIRNKQFDPISGCVPYQDDMQHLLNTLATPHRSQD